MVFFFQVTPNNFQDSAGDYDEIFEDNEDDEHD